MQGVQDRGHERGSYGCGATKLRKWPKRLANSPVNGVCSVESEVTMGSPKKARAPLSASFGQKIHFSLVPTTGLD